MIRRQPKGRKPAVVEETDVCPPLYRPALNRHLPHEVAQEKASVFVKHHERSCRRRHPVYRCADRKHAGLQQPVRKELHLASRPAYQPSDRRVSGYVTSPEPARFVEPDDRTLPERYLLYGTIFRKHAGFKEGTAGEPYDRIFSAGNVFRHGLLLCVSVSEALIKGLDRGVLNVFEHLELRLFEPFCRDLQLLRQLFKRNIL